MTKRKPIGPDDLQATVVRDHKGRIMKGSAALGRAGTPAGRGLTFRTLVRERFREGPEGEKRAREILENLEQMATGSRLEVSDRDQVNAATVLIRLLDGKKAFDHLGDEESKTIDVGGGLGGGRSYADPEGVRRQVAALADVFGCAAEEVQDYIKAAVELRNAQIGE